MSNVDEVRDRIDIVALVSDYATLKKAGRHFKSPCPFHSEKTPSFVVYPEDGRWHCFGACSAGGDAFEFVMRAENVDFRAALQILARRVGVDLAPPSAREAERRDYRDRLREALSMAEAFYRQQIEAPSGAPATSYIQKREFDQEAARGFGVGWAPDSWTALADHLHGAGFDDKALLDSGLAREREQQGGVYDAFRARLMFPIHDDRGRPVGFGARTLDPEGQPKYLNSPQTALFDKSRLLYGLHRAAPAIRDTGTAVVVEGYTDVLRAHSAGFTNVVASLGTALTEHHLATLKRYATRVVLALDADAAGRSAMVRGLDVAQGALAGDVLPVPTAAGWIRYEQRLEVDLRVALLPPGQDPDDVIRQDPAVWEACVADAVPVLSYLFDALTTDLELDEPPGKTEAVRRLMPILATIPDPVSRAAWVEDFADRIRIDPRAMSVQLAALVGKGKGSGKGSGGRTGAGPGNRSERRTFPGQPDEMGAGPDGGGGPALIERRRSDPQARIGALLLGHLLRDPDLVAPLAGELEALGQEPLQPDDYSGGLERDLLIALLNAGRGAVPPDTPPEHRLDSLPDVHAARRLELIAAVDSEPELADDRAVRNLRIAVLRLRRVRRQHDLEGLRFLIADADATEKSEYATQVKNLGATLFDLEKLLAPTSPGFGKVDQAVTRRREI